MRGVSITFVLYEIGLLQLTRIEDSEEEKV